MIFFIKFSSRQNVNLSFLVILFTSPFTNRMVHKMLQKNFNVEIIFVVCFISASSSWHHRHHDRGISDFTVTQNRTHLCCSHSTRSSSFASLVQCSRHQLLDLVATCRVVAWSARTSSAWSAPLNLSRSKKQC